MPSKRWACSRLVLALIDASKVGTVGEGDDGGLDEGVTCGCVDNVGRSGVDGGSVVLDVVGMVDWSSVARLDGGIRVRVGSLGDVCGIVGDGCSVEITKSPIVRVGTLVVA